VTGNVQYGYNDGCVEQCPSGFMVTTSVVSGNTLSYCTACPANCASCSSSTTCTNCSNSFFLSAGTCVSTCPAGSPAQVNAGGVNVCGNCFSTCATCSNDASASGCLTCAANSQLFYPIANNAGSC